MQIQYISGSTPVQLVQDLPQRASVAETPQQQVQSIAENVTTQAVEPVNQKAQAEQLKQAVDNLNKMAESLDRGLEFSIDDETNIKLVKVVDVQSKEVIRQIPSEEAINIARWIDKFQGLLLRDKA